MSEELINYAVSKGIDKQTLLDKQTEYLNIIKQQTSDEKIIEFSVRNKMKGYIKLLLNTKLTNVSGVVLGTKTTDFGQMMKRKYGEVYPESHSRKGEKIPEHDIDKTVILFDNNTKQIVTFSLKNNDAEIDIPNGSAIDITLQQGKKENVFFYNSQLSKLKIHDDIKINYNEIKNIIVNYMKDYQVSLTEMFNTENYKLKVINISNIFDKRFVFDNLYLDVLSDDLDMEKNVSIMIDNNLFNYNDELNEAILLVEKIKSEENKITLKAYSIFADDKFKLSIEKIEDDVSEDSLPKEW